MLSNRESVETKLQRIAEKARKESNCQFTSLFHLMDEEFLRGCFEGLRKDAASGIDRVTKEDLLAMLPVLRTYLGHDSFNETAYYLHMTADVFPYIHAANRQPAGNL